MIVSFCYGKNKDKSTGKTWLFLLTYSQGEGGGQGSRKMARGCSACPGR